MGNTCARLARAVGLLAALLLAVAAPACIPGRDGQPGRINVALAVDPPSPRAAEPATVTLRIFATNGPLTIALTSAYPIEARGPQGQMLSTTAQVASPGTYAAPLVFPVAGRWQISTPTYAGAPGNQLVVIVGSA